MKPPWIRFLAAGELIGGILTILGYVLYVAASPGTLAGWQIALGVGFGAFAAYAGVELMRGSRTGVYASVVVQALQISSFTIAPAVRFVALAGVRIGPIFSGAGIEARVRGGGEFIALPFAPDATLTAAGTALAVGMRVAIDGLMSSQVAFDINFVALYFLWRLLRLSRPGAAAEAELPAAAT